MSLDDSVLDLLTRVASAPTAFVQRYVDVVGKCVPVIAAARPTDPYRQSRCCNIPVDHFRYVRHRIRNGEFYMRKRRKKEP